MGDGQEGVFSQSNLPAQGNCYYGRVFIFKSTQSTSGQGRLPQVVSYSFSWSTKKIIEFQGVIKEFSLLHLFFLVASFPSLTSHYHLQIKTSSKSRNQAQEKGYSSTAVFALSPSSCNLLSSANLVLSNSFGPYM